ncbi:hypothetical protein Lesp02_04160 [Lentzea sp. NBRC 105346]|uniref:ATP/GTP-binding protein n=1 Tax=Lentzea sp. NBRC 105346 TaxID=3032205 RepID=UPI0024A0411C|nr:ATP-binding protein [Lentzea sp. NBRC 105346]GLZ28226.1 hypothetical protein Lesp02_04160 [Lentzea sp. NBRC 105346]
MKRIVLTGGHGVGKSSLLLVLEERGEHVVFEAARDVRLLARSRGVAFPDDQPDFESRVLARHLSREDNVPTHVRRLFLDRGAPDHLAYATVGRWPLTAAEITACRARRYDLIVLVDGPPQGVPTLDRVEQRFCERLVDALEETYTQLGMRLHRLAWADVDSRAETILKLVSDTLGDCGLHPRDRDP